MERALRPALKPISGAYVRVSSPGHPPLSTPTDAPFPGRFHRIGEQAPLYVSSDLSVAWAELLRALPLSQAGHELPTLVTRLEVKDLVVLDLTDRASLATLGIDISDVMTGDRSLTQRLADVARDMRAEGVLVPSRMAPSNDKLVVFASGLGRVQVVDSEIVGLQLADATSDPVLQELLRQDEQLVQHFVAALNDDRFEEWIGSLGLPDTHISSFRSLAREVYEQADEARV